MPYLNVSLIELIPIMGILILIGKNLQMISELRKDVNKAHAFIRENKEEADADHESIVKIWIRLGHVIERMREAKNLAPPEDDSNFMGDSHNDSR